METERLMLRPWREEDAPSLYKYAKNPADRIFYFVDGRRLGKMALM